MLDSDNNVIVDRTRKLNETMKLELDRGGSKVYYSISIMTFLSIKDESVIKEIDNTSRPRSITVYHDKTVREVIDAVETNHDGYYNIFIKDNRGNIIADDSIIISGEMLLYVEVNGSNETFLIKTYIN